MSSLLGSFRAQKSKGKKTTGTGKGRQEVYISKWFAFERMHFLLDKDEPNNTFDTESEQFAENSTFSEDISQDTTEASMSIAEAPMPMESTEAEGFETSRGVELPEKKRNEPLSKKPKRYKEKEDPRIKDAFRLLKDTHEKYTSSQSADRFAIYGQHVAAKLRTYTKKTQAIVEHSINNVLFDADMGKFEISSTISTPIPSPTRYNLSHQSYLTNYNNDQTVFNAATPSNSTHPGSSSRSAEVDEFDSEFILEQLR